MSISEKAEIDELDKYKTTLVTIKEKKDKPIFNPTIFFDDKLIYFYFQEQEKQI